MSGHRKLLTMNGYLPQAVVSELLTSIEASMRRVGATRVWIDPLTHPDLVVMVELPDAHDAAETAQRRDSIRAVS